MSVRDLADTVREMFYDCDCRVVGAKERADFTACLNRALAALDALEARLNEQESELVEWRTSIATEALQHRLAETEQALRGWETRDNDGYPPCSVERGTVADGDYELLVAGIPYDAGCAIEAFIERARRALGGNDNGRTK